MYDSEDVFDMLIYQDQDLTLKHSLEIWKRSAKEEAGKLMNLSLSLRKQP
jgi:hypothetical protein